MAETIYIPYDSLYPNNVGWTKIYDTPDESRIYATIEGTGSGTYLEINMLPTGNLDYLWYAQTTHVTNILDCNFSMKFQIDDSLPYPNDTDTGCFVQISSSQRELQLNSLANNSVMFYNGSTLLGTYTIVPNITHIYRMNITKIGSDYYGYLYIDGTLQTGCPFKLNDTGSASGEVLFGIGASTVRAKTMWVYLMEWQDDSISPTPPVPNPTPELIAGKVYVGTYNNTDKDPSTSIGKYVKKIEPYEKENNLTTLSISLENTDNKFGVNGSVYYIQPGTWIKVYMGIPSDMPEWFDGYVLETPTDSQGYRNIKNIVAIGWDNILMQQPVSCFLNKSRNRNLVNILAGTTGTPAYGCYPDGIMYKTKANIGTFKSPIVGYIWSDKYDPDDGLPCIQVTGNMLVELESVNLSDTAKRFHALNKLADIFDMRWWVKRIPDGGTYYLALYFRDKLSLQNLPTYTITNDMNGHTILKNNLKQTQMDTLFSRIIVRGDRKQDVLGWFDDGLGNSEDTVDVEFADTVQLCNIYAQTIYNRRMEAYNLDLSLGRVEGSIQVEGVYGYQYRKGMILTVIDPYNAMPILPYFKRRVYAVRQTYIDDKVGSPRMVTTVEFDVGQYHTGKTLADIQLDLIQTAKFRSDNQMEDSCLSMQSDSVSVSELIYIDEASNDVVATGGVGSFRMDWSSIIPYGIAKLYDNKNLTKDTFTNYKVYYGLYPNIEANGIIKVQFDPGTYGGGLGAGDIGKDVIDYNYPARVYGTLIGYDEGVSPPVWYIQTLENIFTGAHLRIPIPSSVNGITNADSKTAKDLLTSTSAPDTAIADTHIDTSTIAGTYAAFVRITFGKGTIDSLIKHGIVVT